MGGFFSKKPASQQNKVTQQDRAILELKLARDKIQKYQKKIKEVIGKEDAAARKLLAQGERDKAKRALRLKQYQTKLLEKTQNQIERLQEMVDTIEFAQIEVEVFKGLEAGNSALKQLHSEFSIERVEQLMEDTRESIEYQQEIDSLLSQNMSAEDDSVAQRELDELIALELETTLSHAPKAPTNPTTTSPTKTTQQQQEPTPQRQMALA
eukprot:c21553_g1_i1.p1 GENE.c21553_g1_i1~~c21553_g1_i1.p1  ORF type:complete len:222 (+),score=65.23 c21553_g1_i1:37-666(+)